MLEGKHMANNPDKLPMFSNFFVIERLFTDLNFILLYNSIFVVDFKTTSFWKANQIQLAFSNRWHSPPEVDLFRLFKTLDTFQPFPSVSTNLFKRFQLFRRNINSQHFRKRPNFFYGLSLLQEFLQLSTNICV